MRQGSLINVSMSFSLKEKPRWAYFEKYWMFDNSPNININISINNIVLRHKKIFFVSLKTSQEQTTSLSKTNEN